MEDFIIIDPFERSVRHATRADIQALKESWPIRLEDSRRLPNGDRVSVCDVSLGLKGQHYFRVAGFPALFGGCAYVWSLRDEAIAPPRSSSVEDFEQRIEWLGQVADPFSEAAA